MPPLTAKINVRAPGSKITIPAINQKAEIDFVKVERGQIIYYAVNYWMDGEVKFVTLHENQVSDE